MVGVSFTGSWAVALIVIKVGVVELSSGRGLVVEASVAMDEDREERDQKEKKIARWSFWARDTI